MPVLLLCQGDPQAKNLLRRAIETRYGINPPAIDHLRIGFKGRSRVTVGPITTWVPLEATVYVAFPSQMRMDFVVKPMGLPVQRGVEAFDGGTYRVVRGAKVVDSATDDTQVESIRRRLWAITALLLTPMSDHTTQLIANDEHSFEAKNQKLGDSVIVRIDEAGFVDSVQVCCWNADAGQHQNYTLKPSKTQHQVDGLMVPEKIEAYWDSAISYELHPVQVNTDAELADSVFTLEDMTVQR